MWLDKVKNQENHELNIGSLSRGVSLCLLTAATPSAFANPQGGQIAGGQASIQYGQTTVVTQTTSKAIVNWKDFSIDANETTQFKVPSNKAVTLNRVTGSNISKIMGTLSSNGQVFLVNPNGIVFGKNAKVDVAGLVASTADIHDNDFMSGNYHFQQAPAGSKIINEGTITVHDAGLAALVAPHVENHGIIQAQLGRVALASGSAFTVDLYGDNLITFDASSVVDKGSVENMGRIEANGGTVMLSVAAAEGIVENVVNTSGYISATTVSNKNGKIVLQGYDNSTIKISGTVDVSGKEQGQTGGVIQASADYIQLLNGSFLDASGDAGGGDIHIGSDVFHNPADNHNINTLGLATALRSAQYVYATPDAVVNADSLHSGKGGNVVVWGDKATWFYGSISAAAKGLLGDGGRIETSGKYLDVRGIGIDASSVHGKSGIWLLDPINITISNTSPSNGTFTGTDPSSYLPNISPTPSPSPSNVYYLDIQDKLTAGTSVIISTSLGSFVGDEGDITFTNTTPITWSTEASFTALANRSIIINTGGTNALDNTGAGTINLRADSDATLSGGSFGTVTFTSGTINSSGSGFVNIYYNPAAFTSTLNPYNASITGDATVRQYMLVYNSTNQAGHDLNTIATTSSTWNRSYALAENITALTLTNPIGSSGTAFSGIFSGNDYTITGLTVGGAVRYTGLFGNVAGASASLSNITLVSPTVTSTYASTNGAIGAIAGIVQTGATLSGNFEVEADGTTVVEGLRNVGGLFGILGAAANVSTGSTFSTTITSGTLTVSSLGTSGLNIGGLFGSVAIASASSGTFDALTLTNNAAVTADASFTSVGGIFGAWTGAGLTVVSDMTNNGIISRTAGTSTSMGGIGGSVSGNNTFTGSMTNSANISGSTSVGGLFGAITAGSFAGSMTSSGDVTATASTVGGLIGTFSGATSIITNTTNDFKTTSAITVSGVSNVGGLIGSFGASAIFARETNASNVAGTLVTGTGTNIGGLFGVLTGAITAATDFANNAATSFTNNADVHVTSGGTHTGVAGVIGSFAKTGLTVAANMENFGDITFTGLGSTGSSSTGGVIGSIGNNTLTGNLSNAGDVTGLSSLAGVIGAVSAGIFSGDMDNTGDIVGTGNNGGLLGAVTGGEFSGMMTSSGDVTSTGNSVGGLIGTFSGTTSAITGTLDFALTAPITVTGVSNVGGLIGTFGASAIFSRNIALETPIGTNIIGSNDSIGGLFGILSGAIISANDFMPSSLTNHANILITGATAHNSIGGIFGSITKTGLTIDADMENTGDITYTNTAPTIVGGISGSFANNTFNGSMTNSGDISGASSLGGIVGSITAGTFSSGFYNTGNITGSTSLGGIAGAVAAGVFSGDMDNTGIITGTGSNGGLLGAVTGGEFSGMMTSSGDVTSTGSSVGGLIGGFSGATAALTGSLDFALTAPITVTGVSNVGGLIGTFGASAVFSRNIALETPIGTNIIGSNDSIGGLFGILSGAIISANDFMPSSLTNHANILITGATAHNSIGGIFGSITKTGLTIDADMENTGDITYTGTAPTSVGGISGSFVDNTFNGSMINSGDISGASSLGGLVGSITGGTYTGLFSNAGNVIGSSSSVGGLLGTITNATISGSEDFIVTAGTIQGTGTIGGLVGNMGTDSIFTRSGLIETSTGVQVNGSATNIGGLFGTIASGATLFDPTSINGLINRANVTVTSGSPTGVGGIFGRFLNTTQTVSVDMFNEGNIAFITGATSNSVGGIAGTISGSTFTGNITNAGSVSGFSDVAGIVGTVSGGTFSGNMINLSTGTVTATSTEAGGLFGLISNGTFSGAMTNAASVTGTNNVGGLIGIVSDAHITGASDFTTTAGTISGATDVGGLIGELAQDAVFTRSGNVFTSVGVIVNGTGSRIGGLFGYISNAATTSTDFSSSATLINNANVNATSSSGHDQVGGIFGQFAKTFTGGLTVANNMINNGIITVADTASDGAGGIAGRVIGTAGNAITFTGTLTNTASITSGGDQVGNIFGDMTEAFITNHVVGSGNISGNQNVGGLIGSMTNSALNEAYFLGSVTGVNNVGGIVGNNISGTITDALFGGTIEFTGTNAGGIVGLNAGTINTSLSVGTITGTGTIKGGIAGDNTTGTISNAFYSINTYLGLSAVGTGLLGTSQQGDYDTLGLASTFTPFGWSFPAVWSELSDHYVTLSWCGAACGVINPGYPPPPPPPPPTVPLAQYTVVERMLNQTEMQQYANHTDFHPYLVGSFIYEVNVAGVAHNIKVITFPSRSPESPLELATKALRLTGSPRLALESP